MELFDEMFLAAFKQGICTDAHLEAVLRIIESECYQTLKKIKAIIEDDRLDDPECFEKIEQLVCALEDIGSDGGTRHDFG